MKNRNRNQILIILGLIFSFSSTAQNLDFLTSELTYYRTSNVFHGMDTINCKDSTFTDTIICRVVDDTTINKTNVYKYRYIMKFRDVVDTSFEFRLVTDTSNVNYAWQGNPPFVMLKRAAGPFRSDTLYLEDSPYTSYVFPLLPGTTWLTRPESTGLYTIKTYQSDESIQVHAGNFLCKKVHADILPGLVNDSAHAVQWVFRNVVLKSYIDYGFNDGTFEDGGILIDSTCRIRHFEQYELISYTSLPLVAHKPQKITNKVFAQLCVSNESIKISFLTSLSQKANKVQLFNFKGKLIYSNTTQSNPFYIYLKEFNFSHEGYVLRVHHAMVCNTFKLLPF